MGLIAMGTPILLSDIGDGESAITEGNLADTDDHLPLGRAMHLLLHVKEHVLDLAVSDLKNQTRHHSTVVRALLSLEAYFDSHEFTHVYEPLREKCLKRSTSSSTQHEQALFLVRFFLLYSRHREAFYHFILGELKADKRRQLAVVVVLENIVSKWQTQPESDHIAIVSRLLPSLAQISKGQPPTLLVCTANDVALACSRYAVTLNNTLQSPTDSGQSITLIETGMDEATKERLGEIWGQVDGIISVFEEWRTKPDSIERAGWQGVHQLIACAQYALENDDDEAYQTILLAWMLVTTTLLSKTILSKKSLSPKRQKSLLSYQEHPFNPFSTFAKLTLSAILQKGRWAESWSQDTPLDQQRISNTDTTHGLEKLLTRMLDCFPFKTPYESLGSTLIPRLLVSAPMDRKNNTSLPVITSMLSLLQSADSVTDSEKQNMLHYTLQQPKAVIPVLLKEWDDTVDKTNFQVVILNELVTHTFALADSSPFIEPLVEGLLYIVGQSNAACELLVKCMPSTHLPTLLLRLINMTFTTDMRTNHVCRALIAKALLVEAWTSAGLLIFIDLVRALKERGALATRFTSSFSSKTSPNDLLTAGLKREEKGDILSEQDLTKRVGELLSSLDLWGRKAEQDSLEDAIGQLVRKTYGVPEDLTYIHAWKMLANTLAQNESLIWVVIQHCLQIMKEQPTKLDVPDSESLIFYRLSPMLILQTIPTEAYTHIGLCLSDRNQMKPAWALLRVTLAMVKESHNLTAEKENIAKGLVEELFMRASLPSEYQQINELARGLMLKIFCKHPSVRRVTP